MKLYISFDAPLSIAQALSIAKIIADHVDGFCVGPLFIYHNGLTDIPMFKQQFPDKTLIIDSKIVEHGTHIANLLFDVKADWISVMAGARTSVIHNACTTAHERKKKVVLDISDAYAKEQSALDAQRLRVDSLYVYIEQNTFEEANRMKFHETWNMIKENTKIPLWMGGKIDQKAIENIAPYKPDAICIGKPIIESLDPLNTLLAIKEALY